MKIRTDYVTNSSSSSFIVGFKSEDNIEKQLYDSMMNYNSRYDTVLNDIKNERNRLTKEQALESFREEIEFDVEWAIERKYQRQFGFDWLENSENKKKVKAEISEKIAKLCDEFKDKIKDYEFLAEVEYSDHCDGDLEHEIMPYLDCTLKSFSHH
ncbi:MAG: hypothetical protein IKO36_11335 [Bacteroidaceae bacterium]|nr:hypothetical protein [Bacteroidaceae bacterium]